METEMLLRYLRQVEHEGTERSLTIFDDGSVQIESDDGTTYDRFDSLDELQLTILEWWKATIESQEKIKKEQEYDYTRPQGF